jgi:hypothetical protein
VIVDQDHHQEAPDDVTVDLHLAEDTVDQDHHLLAVVQDQGRHHQGRVVDHLWIETRHQKEKEEDL